MKKIIQSSSAPLPIGPYSQAVLAGNTLYLSGQIAIDPATQEYTPTDIESETSQVLANIDAVLKAAGMGFEHIVKTSIFLADMNDFAKVNALYSTCFSSEFPARETVQVSVLPKNAKIEISIIAFDPKISLNG
ncbi:MAG: RidA family protein [Crocinitomicaceae bacterium]|nr:RidA family protein [Crocinitomicaceae bacterium]